MSSDVEVLRDIARQLLRMAEGRRANNDIYSSLRGLAFDCSAIALVVEDDDTQRAFVAESPTQPGVRHG